MSRRQTHAATRRTDFVTGEETKFAAPGLAFLDPAPAGWKTRFWSKVESGKPKAEK